MACGGAGRRGGVVGGWGGGTAVQSGRAADLVGRLLSVSRAGQVASQGEASAGRAGVGAFEKGDRAGGRGEERGDQADLYRRRGRPHAATGFGEEADGGAAGSAEEVGGAGREV